MIEIIFWMFVGLIIYTYLGYPILLFFAGLFIKRSTKKSLKYLPSVSLIITAYNEEKVIEEKIKNCLSLDYPKDKLQIIIGSDGSTDKTDEIVKKHANKRVILNRIEGRKGKTATLNSSVKIADGEILVFSDANSMYHKNAIKELVKHFVDSKIGCVCGQLSYRTLNPSIKGEEIYWHYEKLIKKLESNTGSITGANGSIYSVRKNLFKPIKNGLDDDFLIPIICYRQGFRSIFEPCAISVEILDLPEKAQFKAKTRTFIRGYRSLLSELNILNPLNYPILSFKLFSHKLIRWLIPFILPIIFLMNIFMLDIILYKFTFGIQFAFYFISIFGGILNNQKLRFFYYYNLINIAGIYAFIKLVLGEKNITWEKNSKILNALSFDIEDWYQVENLKEVIKFEDWTKYEQRLDKNVDKILLLLNNKNIKATFFILGWVAKYYPNVLKKIVNQGHEIATHGYSHKPIFKQKPEEFEKELRKSIRLIEKITNKKILGHRAASFSITKKSLWALDILKRKGLKYDSSIFPIKRNSYGIPDAPVFPYNIKKGLVEFPMSTIKFLGRNIPVGGGYFRVVPYFITKWVIKRINRENRPAIIYLHPWEFDPDQPRLNVSFYKKFRHYTNLAKTEEKFKRLLDDFEFAPVKDVLKI